MVASVPWSKWTGALHPSWLGGRSAADLHRVQEGEGVLWDREREHARSSSPDRLLGVSMVPIPGAVQEEQGEDGILLTDNGMQAMVGAGVVGPGATAGPGTSAASLSGGPGSSSGLRQGRDGRDSTMLSDGAVVNVDLVTETAQPETGSGAVDYKCSV